MAGNNRYDLVIIGGGSAAFGAAIKANLFGVKTAMIERDVLGGTCVNVGCVPSKNLLGAGELLHSLKHPMYPAWKSFTKTPLRKMQLIYELVTFVLVLQSWHFIEHAVKLDQPFVNGCVSCPDILRHYFDVILLHLTYNTIVYVPLIVVFAIFQYKFVVEAEKVQE